MSDFGDWNFTFSTSTNWKFYRVALIYLDYNVWYLKNIVKATLTGVPLPRNWGTLASKVAYGTACKDAYQKTGKTSYSYGEEGFTDDYMQFQDATLPQTTAEAIKEVGKSPFLYIVLALIGYYLYTRKKTLGTFLF